MRAQASMEMFLLMAGVVLAAAVAGYYAVSSTVSVYNEFNAVVSGGGTTGAVSFAVSPSTGNLSTVFTLNCSASGGSVSTIVISVDGSTLTTCSSSPCTYNSTFSAGTHTAQCVVTDSSSNTYTKTASFSVADAPPTVSATVIPTTGDTTTTFNLSCSANDDSAITTIDLYVCAAGSCTLRGTCTINAVSGSCSDSGTFSAGNYELNCVAMDDSGKSSYGTALFTVTTSTLTNNPPTASFIYSPTNPTTADTVVFVPNVSDADGDPLTCDWDFGDGATFTDPSCGIVSHMYISAGTYTVTLSVSDGTDTNTATKTITVVPASTDTAPPSVTLAGVPSTWQNTDASISVGCSDSGSGCDTTSYRIYTSTSAITSCPTDYTQYTQTSPTTISSHVWACGAAKDLAGNVGFSPPYEILVDETAPTISLSPPPGPVSTKTFTVSAVCSDADSGCASIYMYSAYGLILTSCPDPGSSYTKTSSINVTIPCFGGGWFGSFCIPVLVCAYAIDNAGNQSSVVSGQYIYAP